MKRLKYVVSVGYNEFEFEDDLSALNFAKTAKRSYTDKRYSDEDDIEVKITMKFIESEEKEDE